MSGECLLARRHRLDRRAGERRDAQAMVRLRRISRAIVDSRHRLKAPTCIS